MSTLHFRIYKSPSSTSISLQNIDLRSNVNLLRKKLADSNKEIISFNLIFSGQVLQDDDILQDVGISEESLLYCTPKYEASAPASARFSLMESQQLMSSLRMAVSNLNFQSSIHKLRSIEQTERLISECPALQRDPAILAFVQDPDLIISLLRTNLDKYLDERPTLGRILQIVCTLINSEVSSPRRSHHISYSMDALSDEEMELEQNDGESASSSRPGGLSSFQPITPAQLAAALASAAGGGSLWGGASSSSAPRSGLTTPSASSTPFNTPAPNSGSRAGGSSPGGQAITTEMFSQALQNALAASASRSSGAAVPSEASSGTASTPAPSIENLQESLQLMREMGIADEGMAIQALQATNGDVQAAVNLIFAQWMADD